MKYKKITIAIILVLMTLILDFIYPKHVFRVEKLNSITYDYTNGVRSNFDTFSVDYEVQGEIGKYMIIVDHKSRIFGIIFHTSIIPHFDK